MKKNNILDYEQVEQNLQKITEEGIIKEAEDLGKTEHGLSIKHYVVGEGNNDIVITGATHGSEIITTDFVIKLMKEISNKKDNWKDILKNFKIHFVPILNPEGYLIATSAIRKLIPRDMSQDEAEKICKQYYTVYKEDDNKEIARQKSILKGDKNTNNLKKHQEMFEGIDYTYIPEKYASIRNSVEEIFEKYPDLPKWCLHIWSSNGNGIDIQANSKYNPKISKIMKDETLYMNSLKHNNIDISHPGPINCPFDKEKGFKIEKETAAISNLLESLNKEGKLFAYLNYHSTGGIIFQRPAIAPEDFNISQDEMTKKEIINYMFAKLYSDKTYKNTGINEDGKNKKEISKYIISTQNAPATSSNDIFRIMYPQDLLIELSGMGGNPIGPYGDIKGNYTNAIKSNLDAVKYTLNVGSISQMIAEASYKFIKKFEDKEDYNKVIEIEDMIYQEFSKKVKQLDKIEKDKYNEKEKNQDYDRDR